MTTTIHAYSSYIMDGCELQIVHRNPETGAETILVPAVAGHMIHTHHVHDGAELVFREVKKGPVGDGQTP